MRLALIVLMFTLTGCNLAIGGQPTATPVPTPDLPRVSVLSPPNNVQVIEGTDFDIDIVARDETQGIAMVALTVDGEPVNEASPEGGEAVPVFRVTMNWLARGTGFHIIEVVAFRANGQQSDPVLLSVEVLPRPA